MITLEQLEVDIMEIYKSLPVEQTLPVDVAKEPIISIFGIATTKATKYGRKILIEITIPISMRTPFNMYKATPIPFKINKHTFMIRPRSTHFLISEDESKYIPITPTEIRLAIKKGQGEVVYRPTAMVASEKEGICEWKAFREEGQTEILEACELAQIPTANYIIEVSENEAYFAAIETPMTIITTCNQQSTQETCNMYRRRFKVNTYYLGLRDVHSSSVY